MSAAEKIRQQATDPLENRAAKEGHRRVLGPGEPALSEWATAGLALPDLEGMRSWRLGRTRAQLSERGLAGGLLFDPLNIFYAVDASNMQVWVLHNQARYAFAAQWCSSTIRVASSSRVTTRTSTRCEAPHP